MPAKTKYKTKKEYPNSVTTDSVEEVSTNDCEQSQLEKAVITALEAITAFKGAVDAVGALTKNFADLLKSHNTLVDSHNKVLGDLKQLSTELEMIKASRSTPTTQTIPATTAGVVKKESIPAAKPSTGDALDFN